MNWIQKTFLWIGIAIIVAMGIFPPWIVGKTLITSKDGGYHFILSPPEVRYAEGYSLNTSRLLIQWAMVVVITGGLIVTFKGWEIKKSHKKAIRNICFLFLLSTLIAVVWVFLALPSLDNMLSKKKTHTATNKSTLKEFLQIDLTPRGPTAEELRKMDFGKMDLSEPNDPNISKKQTFEEIERELGLVPDETSEPQNRFKDFIKKEEK